MPATKQTLRYRGRVRILLKRVVKVATQVNANNIRYPEPPQNRNHIFSADQVAELLLLKAAAQQLLEEKWPPLDMPALAAPAPPDFEALDTEAH